MPLLHVYEALVLKLLIHTHFSSHSPYAREILLLHVSLKNENWLLIAFCFTMGGFQCLHTVIFDY